MEKMDSEQYQKEIAVLRTQLEAANRKILQIEADAKVDQEMTHEQVQMLETRAATIQNKLRKEVSKREDAEIERDRLKGQISGLKDTKAKDTSEIERLKNRNSALEKEKKDNQLKFRQLGRMCRQLCSDYREESIALKALILKFPETPAELLGDAFVAQLQAKAEEIFSIRMTTIQQENERSSQEKQIQLLKDMEEDMRQRVSTYENELEKNGLEVDQLNEEITAKEEEIKNLNSRLAEYERNATDLQAELLQNKTTSNDILRSNEAKVQSIQENLEAQRLEIENLEKDREDIIMGKMRDISALEDQIGQLHYQYDSERRRANALMNELSKIKQVEDSKIFTVFDPELAMAGMTSIQSLTEEAITDGASTAVGKMDYGPSPSGPRTRVSLDNDINGDFDTPHLRLPSTVRTRSVKVSNDDFQHTIPPADGLNSWTNGEAENRHTADFKHHDSQASCLDGSEVDKQKCGQEGEGPYHLKIEPMPLPSVQKDGISEGNERKEITEEPLDEDTDFNQLTITTRPPVSVVNVNDLSKAIERDMTMVAEVDDKNYADESIIDDEAQNISDIEAVVEQASQMLLALDSVQKRLENLQGFEEFSEDLFNVTDQQASEWKQDISEAEFESNDELEREARLVIEELERDSKDTPLDTQLQLLKVKYDEGKISLREHKRARVLLMYSQSMIDTEKAEQQLGKAHKSLVELREKRAEVARSEAQPILESTFEALERISEQNEELTQRLDELQAAFALLVPSHVNATQLLSNMSVFVDEIEDQAEHAQSCVQQAVKAEGDAEKFWYQKLRSYDRSLRNCHIMERFCKGMTQATLADANQYGLSNYVSWFYNVK